MVILGRVWQEQRSENTKWYLFSQAFQAEPALLAAILTAMAQSPKGQHA